MTYDVAVAGLGAMGSAIAARAALAGARVIGFEQFARGHDLGSFAGSTRIIRKAYFENAAYVPLLLRAYELWDDLEHRTGRDLRRACGLLLCGLPSSEVIEGSLRAARVYELPVDALSARDVRARFPQFAIADDEVGVFERAGGTLFSEAAVAAHLEVAERAGAELHFETALQGWSSDGSRVTIEFAGGTRYDAASLALTMGAWLEPEFLAAGVPFEVQRNVQAWFAPLGDRFRDGEMPAYLIDRPALPAPLYGFPDFGEGLKAALHGVGVRTHAAELIREIDERADAEPVRAALGGWLPDAAGALLRAKACMYALTPDHHFVIDRHPRFENVVLCGGFSGHGFKFASVVGEVVSDLLCGKASRHDLAFLSAHRFSDAPAR